MILLAYIALCSKRAQWDNGTHRYNILKLLLINKLLTVLIKWNWTMKRHIQAYVFSNHIPWSIKRESRTWLHRGSYSQCETWLVFGLWTSSFRNGTDVFQTLALHFHRFWTDWSLTHQTSSTASCFACRSGRHMTSVSSNRLSVTSNQRSGRAVWRRSWLWWMKRCLWHRWV